MKRLVFVSFKEFNKKQQKFEYFNHSKHLFLCTKRKRIILGNKEANGTILCWV